MKPEVAAPLILVAVVAAGWLMFTGVAVSRAVLPDTAQGLVLAAFPWRADDDAVFAAVVGAGGQPLRRTWLPNVWVAAGDDPGFVGRLRAAGAWATFGEVPVGLPQLGGCAVVSGDTAKVAKLRLNP